MLDEFDDNEDAFEPIEDAVSEFDSRIEQLTMHDDDKVLLGPEYKVARYNEDNNLMAVAIRDIFDKKVAQKVIRFFVWVPKRIHAYGEPMVSYTKARISSYILFSIQQARE